jgi:hypothetical protein
MLAMVALSLGILGCSVRSPNASDVVGRWTVEASLAEMVAPRLGGRLPVIVLAADGRFSVRDFPGEWVLPRERGVARLDGQGAWRLLRAGGSDCVQLNFDAIDGYKGVLPIGTQLDLDGRGPGARLSVMWFYPRDRPGAEEVIWFERR